MVSDTNVCEEIRWMGPKTFLTLNDKNIRIESNRIIEARYIHIPELQHGHFGVSDGERGLPTKKRASGDWAMVCKVRMK